MVSGIFITFDPKNNINQMEIENNKYLYYTIIAGCIICMVAVCFNVFTDMELPSRIMAAILGVVITATITQLLLKGQTRKEVGLKRDSKIFEEKLRIYQNFLNVLYQAVKDRELSDSEKLELQFQTSLIAMLCEPKNIEEVSKAIKGVIEGTCYKETQSNPENPEQARLLENLFKVVNAFRMDLYDEDAKKFDDKKDEIVQNFNAAFNSNNLVIGTDEPEKPQKLSVDLNVVSNQLSQTVSVLQTNAQNQSSVWEKNELEWESDGWKVTGPKEGERYWLEISRDNNPGVINVGFDNGHYYIQAEYEDDTNFSQGLKSANGGRRQRGAWWDYLPEPYYGIPMGGLSDRFNTDVKLQEYLVSRIKYLQSVILKYNQTVQWKNMLDKDVSDKWTYFIYNWSCLACQCNDEKEGKLYIDILPVEYGGKTVVEFRLGNRAGNVKMLSETLHKHGYQDKKIDKDCWACVGQVDSLDASKIAEKANELIQKLL